MEGRWKELRGIQGGKIIIRIYYVRKKIMFNKRKIIGGSCSLSLAILWVLHPFASTLSAPYHQRRKKKRTEGKGKISLNKVKGQKEEMLQFLAMLYFLPIRGCEFLGASLIFSVRISNFFLFLLCTRLPNKPQPSTTHQQLTNNPPPLLLGPWHLYTP